MHQILQQYVSSQSSAHHEEQSVEQPPCCCGLPLGPPGQRAALPTQSASPGRRHDSSTNGVRLYNLTEPEKMPLTEMNSWLDRLVDVLAHIFI